MANKKKAIKQPRASENAASQMEKITQRAYELYQQRGCEHGHDFEDWLKAEAEVTAFNATPKKDS